MKVINWYKIKREMNHWTKVKQNKKTKVKRINWILLNNQINRKSRRNRNNRNNLNNRNNRYNFKVNYLNKK